MKQRSFAFWPVLLATCCSSLGAIGCRPKNATAGDTTAPSPTAFPYNLSAPAQHISLSALDLQEISGLGATGKDHVLCAVSDEKGTVFMLDMAQNGAVLQSISFKEKGDFEGVEWVNDTLYAVQSNGKLSEITGWQNDATPITRIFPLLEGEEHDIEGLAHDPVHHRLLIAFKEDPESDRVRQIWAFDLHTHTFSAEAVYTINPKDIDELLPLDNNDKQRSFSPSGVAVHPHSGDIYVVSTALKRLIILDPSNGKLKNAARIEKDLIGQPEGIAFDKKGNLYISSEKKKENAAIFRFAPVTSH